MTRGSEHEAREPREESMTRIAKPGGGYLTVEERRPTMSDYISPCEDCRRNCEIPCWKVGHGLLRPVARGKWRKSELLNYNPECSVCSYVSRERYNYCPNCGADMRGGRQ